MDWRDDIDFDDPAALLAYRAELLAIADANGPNAQAHRRVAEMVQQLADGLLADTPEISPVSGLTA